jgi:hypothetical protein
MPVLESKLVIGAKDETGGAFGAIKTHIAALDKQIATFDKLMAATRGVAKANDPMIASIDRGAKAVTEEKAALESLARVMTSGTASAEEMAVAQGRLAASIVKANHAMVAQGSAAARVTRAQERSRKGGGLVGGMAGGIIALGGAEVAVKALEAGASLEQMKFRVRGVSGSDKTESPFAEQLAADVAAKYPAITQAKALDTYLELRGNAANQNGTINQEIARRNLMTVAQAQTASLAIGAELTPEDAQNLLKAVEGSGRSGDPTAVGKMFDSYIRARQVFGSAIDSSKIRDYVQNAKGANFGIGEEQFFWQNIVRMTEGNASRLGNETAQTLQTLVGGHATKQTAKWLVGMGLATGFTPQGGGAATIHGLSGSGTLQVNQLDWANQFLLPALMKKGVLSEANIAGREALLRKDNPNIDPRALRERAEQGLISSAIARSGMRTTVTDNLAHAIANELLINRDVAQMKGASGSAELAGRIGQNPVAAMAELTGSLSNFAAVLTGPAMKGAAAALDALARSINTFTAGLAKEQAGQDKGAPSPAIESTNRHINRLLFGKDTPDGGWGMLKNMWNNLFAPDAAPPQLPAAGAPEHHWGPWHAGGTPTGPIIADRHWTPTGVALGGAADNAKLAAASAMPVTVSGQAQVDHTVHVEVTLDPDLRAKIDQVVNSQAFTVPLIGGGSGQMDSDAGPHRSGGIGRM